MTSRFAKLHQRAGAIWSAGLAAADPARAVRAALRSDPLPPCGPGGAVFVLGIGKAGLAMAGAALAELSEAGRPVKGALVVTNYENAGTLAGATVRAAGHPVPDENGAAAGREVLARLAELQPGDRVLALISGGGSALLPAPVDGVSLDDKIKVNHLLLASGADIAEINLVRQQLSRLKGGGLLRAAAPTRVSALILSDVVGDDLSVVASGPTVAPVGSRAQARAALVARGLWPEVPASVRAHLDGTGPALPPLPLADNRLIGSNATSLVAMGAAGAQVNPAPLVGDVGPAARTVIAAAAAVVPGGAIAFGGETTVILRGTGKGGRNQELALRFALLAATLKDAPWALGDWTFLAAGTDGRDGPTEAAGGIVDPQTLHRMRAAGIDPQAALAQNDSHTALAAAGALFVTGGTGTNVADLCVFVRG